ncbi:GNAT family N-acetyltransferase [Mycobacterium szulgai]|uniref:GCN5 family acetyltransferase n=1 Tax=Mycobacterium szulgai TaxID=1787 RepID=A0A1X2DLL2_MYCSZ|nr:DUF4081 domain-containing protein [Mycobacterium szulgai]MCV7077537.1 DUF4081 domain-containing protein [Mycobacterium szulgai]ORW89021.1 GCN5 family acetyltransferase [Mycobacterium szulgai]
MSHGRFPPANPTVSVVCDLAAVSRVLDDDPVVTCMCAELAENPRGAGGELWTCGRVDESLCYSGAALIPLRGLPVELESFADKALRGSRRYTWLMGRPELAIPMWQRLAPVWGPARYVRADQPVLAIDRMPDCAVDPAVRQVEPCELEAYRAATATEIRDEFGVDPDVDAAGRNYRRRLAHIIAAGRAWARFEDGAVVFKAEVGVQSARAALIQGVWVHPQWRGRGLCAPGTAAVVSSIVGAGRIACGYVAHSNAPARAAYDRVGFTQVGSVVSILLA